MTQADRLMREIELFPDRYDDGILANDLLAEFHKGYPVDRLRKLLTSNEQKVVMVGAFIASELGVKARPLLNEVDRLLHHPVALVRCNAIDSLLSCGTSDDGQKVAKVVRMVDDPDPAVRGTVLNFLARASRAQLLGAFRVFESTQPRSNHLIGLNLLVNDPQIDPNQVVRFLRDNCATVRKYGVAGAARLGTSNSNLLSIACALDDTDVRVFATSWKKMLDSFAKLNRNAEIADHLP